MLKLTNKTIAVEVNTFFGQYSGIKGGVEYTDHGHYDGRDDYVSITDKDTGEDVMTYLWDMKFGETRPQGRSKAFINRIHTLYGKPSKGWILKRIVATDDDTEIRSMEQSERVSDTLFQHLLENDHVYSPNFTKNMKLFYSQRQDTKFMCHLSEESHYTLREYFHVFNRPDSRITQPLQSLLFQTFHALETAFHKCGFIHYDLSAANVMIQDITNSAALSLQSNYTWLYQRINGLNTGLLYKPTQLKRSSTNQIVKIIDYGGSKLSGQEKRVNYFLKRDVSLFLIQLLIFVIPPQVELDKGFIKLCERAISFNSSIEENGVYETLIDALSLDDLTQQEEKMRNNKMVIPSACTVDQWLDYTGIMLTDGNVPVVGNDKKKFYDFVRKYDVGRAYTVDDLRGFSKMTDPNTSDIEKVVLKIQYELRVQSMMFRPSFSKTGLTPSEALNSPYFDSIRCDLTVMYTEPCILLSYEDNQMMEPQNDANAVDQQTQKPLKATTVKKPPKVIDTTTTTTTTTNDPFLSTTMIYDTRDVIEKAIKPYCQYQVVLRRFKSVTGGNSCYSLDATNNQSVIKETVVHINGVSVVKEKSASSITDTLLAAYHNFTTPNYVSGDEHKNTIVLDIKPQEWLVIKIGEQGPEEVRIATRNERITFVYPYELKYILNPFMLPLPYNGNIKVSDSSYLVYKRVGGGGTTVVNERWSELFAKNKKLAETLIYTSFKAYIDAHQNGFKAIRLNNKKNDCYKIAILQTLRHVLYVLQQALDGFQESYYIPKVIQDIYDEQNAQAMQGKTVHHVNFKEFDELIVNTTTNKNVINDVTNGEQCDATEVFSQIWNLIFDVNTCNSLIGGNNSHVQFLPHFLPDNLINDAEVHTKRIVTIPNFKSDNTNVFFISYIGADTDAINGHLTKIVYDQFVTKDNIKFVLVALIVHIGVNKTSGHYVTYINPRSTDENGPWLLYDDREDTHLVDFKDVPTKESEPHEETTLFEGLELKDVGIVRTPYLGIYVHDTF
jgi:serine/threonine protein kinase